MTPSSTAAFIVWVVGEVFFAISGLTALFVICYDLKRAWPRIKHIMTSDEPYEEPGDDHHPWK